MSAPHLRAASGQAADDQDPETNGMAENEDGRLEMDNLLKQLGETLREVEESMRKWAEDLQAEMDGVGAAAAARFPGGLHGRRGCRHDAE